MRMLLRESATASILSFSLGCNGDGKTPRYLASSYVSSIVCIMKLHFDFAFIHPHLLIFQHIYRILSLSKDISWTVVH